MPQDNGGPHEFTYSKNQGDQLVSAIVDAVSWVKGSDVLSLAPLEDVVDTEGLQRLFSRQEPRGDFYRSSAAASSEFPQVCFEYEECLVAVSPNNITIEPVS